MTQRLTGVCLFCCATGLRNLQPDSEDLESSGEQAVAKSFLVRFMNEADGYYGYHGYYGDLGGYFLLMFPVQQMFHMLLQD